MNLYIVRHGQTYTNLDRVVCGQMDTKMTTLGHQQVEKTAKILKDIEFNYLYTSPLLRARETASYFSKMSNFKQVEDLKEMNTGSYSILKVQELWSRDPRYKYQGRFQFLEYPQGESLAILFGRISNWLKLKIQNKWQQGHNVLVVGHEATVVCAIHSLLQIPLENYPSFKIKNAGVVKITIDVEDNQVRVAFL